MRSAVAVLLAYRARTVRAAIRRASWAQLAVAGAFLALAAVLFAGAFAFFFRAFRFVLEDAVAGPIIVRYVIDVAFAFVLLLGVASFVVSSFGIFFRSDELSVLLASGADPLDVFLSRFAAATALASWPVVIVALPAVLALGAALGAGPSYFAFGFAAVLLFALAISVIGCLAAFAFAPLVRRLSIGALSLVEVGAFILVSWALVRRTIPRSAFVLFGAGTDAEAAAAADRIAAMFAPIPSHPFAEVVSSIARPAGPFAAGLTLGTAAAALAAGLFLLLVVAARAYVPLWQRYNESGLAARPADVPPRRRRSPFPRLFRFGHGFLFEKDLLTFVRDGREVSRALFLLLLLLLYVLSARAVSLVGELARSELFAPIVAFAFAAMGYFALTFGMRFAFPSLSQEGKAAWIVWSSPLHAHELFSWKFFFWSALMAPLMGATAALISSLFALPAALAAYLLMAAVLSAMALVAVTLGQGSMFPSFRSRDPDTVSTSPAGLGAMAVGIGYLFVVIRYVHRAVALYVGSGTFDANGLFGVLVVSVAVIALFWTLAHRTMDRMEIVP
jgi:ABC-2 type transport system permease protein